MLEKEIFEKSIRTISGCSTREQLQSAQSFIDLYRVQTNDEEGFKNLQQLLFAKDRELFPLEMKQNDETTHEETI